MSESKDRSLDFKSLVESHQEKVRNTCFRFVKNSEDADGNDMHGAIRFDTKVEGGERYYNYVRCVRDVIVTQ